MWNPLSLEMSHAMAAAAVAAAPAAAADTPPQRYSGDLMKGSANAKCYCYLIEVLAYTGKVTVEETGHDKTFRLIRYGIGFRIAVVAWGLDIQATANLGSVAATAQLGGGQSSVKVDVFAQDIADFGPKMAGITTLTGQKFDAAMLQRLAGFADELTDVMAQHGHLQPRAVQAATLRPMAYSRDHAVASNNFAIAQLAQGQPASNLGNWTAAHPDWKHQVLNPFVIQAAYENFGITSLESRPTAEQQEDARKVLNLGA